MSTFRQVVTVAASFVASFVVGVLLGWWLFGDISA